MSHDHDHGSHGHSHAPPDRMTRAFAIGRDCTAVDLFLTMIAHWSRKMARPARSYANIGKLMALVEARPSWRKMMSNEGNS